ncbi:MAG: hydantoinase/oxoprolinase family protein [Nitrososphaerota archaeon]|nr:hydantoinase/oxoprolinase family protein [Nitrososphaerota archaeon]
MRIGIDVGGTHTDAVILDSNNRIVEADKIDTTQDVSSGILAALDSVLRQSSLDGSEISAIMFGTTHCTNAIVERKNLSHVGILRLGKPATLAIPPLFSLPDALKRAIGDTWEIVPGGHEFDGREICAFDEDGTRIAAKDFKSKGVEAVAISAVFSPVNSEHEKRAAKIFSQVMGPNVPITISSEVGSIGLLERENAAVLNAALSKVAETAINGLVSSVRDRGLHSANIYLTQNDGTLMNVNYAKKHPVKTIASGPTNSIRGAAYLTSLGDAVVVDIGGTTTLVGAIAHGFPRESNIAVEIGQTRTNFRMPDLVAVSCGGGTIVTFESSGSVIVGPQSVGYMISKHSIAWGGNKLTTTDVALGLGHASALDNACHPERVSATIGREKLVRAQEKIMEIVEEAIDKIKVSSQPVKVVLVGGGGIIIPESMYDKIAGVSEIIRPAHFQFANAIGAAIAQISGQSDRIYDLDKKSREQALEEAKRFAIEDALSAGADPVSVEVVESEELPLSYLPGIAVRIKMKVVGRLTPDKQ